MPNLDLSEHVLCSGEIDKWWTAPKETSSTKPCWGWENLKQHSSSFVGCSVALSYMKLLKMSCSHFKNYFLPAHNLAALPFIMLCLFWWIERWWFCFWQQSPGTGFQHCFMSHNHDLLVGTLPYGVTVLPTWYALSSALLVTFRSNDFHGLPLVLGTMVSFCFSYWCYHRTLKTGPWAGTTFLWGILQTQDKGHFLLLYSIYFFSSPLNFLCQNTALCWRYSFVKNLS